MGGVGISIVSIKNVAHGFIPKTKGFWWNSSFMLRLAIAATAVLKLLAVPSTAMPFIISRRRINRSPLERVNLENYLIYIYQT